MIGISDLPAVNAGLNSTATVLLLAGWVFVRRGRIRGHARCMVSAFAVSVLFLTSYIVYHYHHPTTRYEGEGLLRAVYLSVLATHIVLAVAVPPLAIRTLWLAARRRWPSHRRWARWTFPIWLYVSVTGVVVYLMLYVLPP